MISRMHMNIVDSYHSIYLEWTGCAHLEFLNAPSEPVAFDTSVKLIHILHCLSEKLYILQGVYKVTFIFIFISLAHLDLLSLNYLSSICSRQRLVIVKLIPPMFQYLLYYRIHKPKEMVSGYVISEPHLGYNIYIHCLNQSQKWRWFSPFTTRRRGLLMVVIPLYIFSV